MDEHSWLGATDPAPMLDFLGGQASARKLRLFACACCRQVWHLLTDPRSRQAVEVAERYADGQASERERATARASALAARPRPPTTASRTTSCVPAPAPSGRGP